MRFSGVNREKLAHGGTRKQRGKRNIHSRVSPIDSVPSAPPLHQQILLSISGFYQRSSIKNGHHHQMHVLSKKLCMQMDVYPPMSNILSLEINATRGEKQGCMWPSFFYWGERSVTCQTRLVKADPLDTFRFKAQNFNTWERGKEAWNVLGLLPMGFTCIVSPHSKPICYFSTEQIPSTSFSY